MSAPQEEKKPLPSVEYSQKYMSWHLKEMNESFKALASSARNIEKILTCVAVNKNNNSQQGSSPTPKSEEIPF